MLPLCYLISRSLNLAENPCSPQSASLRVVSLYFPLFCCLSLSICMRKRSDSGKGLGWGVAIPLTIYRAPEPEFPTTGETGGETRGAGGSAGGTAAETAGSSRQGLGSVFGRTDFSRISIFGQTDSSAEFVAGLFLLIFVGGKCP